MSMGRADDVEFLAEDGSESASGDDVLTIGGPRRGRRWLWPGVVVAVLVFGAGALVGRAVSHHSASSPSATGSHSQTLVKAPPPVAPSSTGQPLQVGNGVVLDVLVRDRHTWVLRANRLTGLGVAAGRNRAVTLPAGLFSPNAALRLVPDGTNARLWVVREGTGRGRAIEYDLWSLTRLRDVRLPWVNGAAAMDGHLYVTSGGHLLDIRPRGATRTLRVAGAPTGVGSIAADPDRSRLLILDYGYPSQLWVYRPGQSLVARSRARLPVAKGTIAVADGAVWVGGFSTGSATLWRLDPSSDRPVGVSPLSGELHPGAVIVAAGQHVFWVRSGGGGDDLWCVSATTGRAAQHWNVSGAVASTAGIAAVGTESGAAALPLTGCAG